MTNRPVPLLDEGHVAALDLGPAPMIGLDFDGTLTPIVATPDLADLSADARAVLSRLSRVVTVVIISGRDADDVRRRCGVPAAAVAGSHGFDIIDRDGVAFPDAPTARFQAILPLLDQVETALRARFGGDGVLVERKRFGVATHYRLAPDRADDVREVATEIAGRHSELTVMEGKAVVEIRPAAPWDKGRALSWLIERLGPVSGTLYIGDDTTDEDVFRVLDGVGTGILVAADERRSAASWRVPDPAAVIRLLANLADHYSPGS